MFDSSARAFLFSLIKEKPIYIVAIFASSFVSTICGILVILLLIPILPAVFNNSLTNFGTNSSLLAFIMAIAQNIVEEDRRLFFLVSIAVLTILIRTINNYLVTILNIYQTKYLVWQIKKRAFKLLCRANINYFNLNQTGDILFVINREINRIVIVIKNFQLTLVQIFNIAIYSAVLAFISPQLSLISLVLITLLAIANKNIVYLLKKRENLSSQVSQVHNHKLIEFLTGIRHIKNTANEPHEYQELERSLSSKIKVEQNTQILSAIITPLNEVFRLTILLVINLSGYYFYDKQFQTFAPILLTYNLILFQFIISFGKLNNARHQFINNKSSIPVVVDFLTKTKKTIIKSGQTAFACLQNKIELQNITFAYPNHAQIVLDKVNLKIERGKTIALIGSSGSGKSTLVSLLSRFYEPIEGKITIDNQDIAEYTLASLRKAIVVIEREPFLFNTSIFNNLTYGLNSVSETDVTLAAKVTKAYDFISQLPNGFDSIIDDKKNILSQSQKLLIAITRALLSKPELVILDASLANLNESERIIVQNSLDKLCCDRTNIIITNRLATIKKADRIIILNKGRVIESGTHTELLKHGSLYKRMYSAQFKTSQQSRQQLLAKKISRKLSHQANSDLSYEIRNNLNSLLNYLQLVNEGLIEDDLEQEKILDESYQSAKNMLASLREYERKISRGLKKKD